MKEAVSFEISLFFWGLLDVQTAQLGMDLEFSFVLWLLVERPSQLCLLFFRGKGMNA